MGWLSWLRDNNIIIVENLKEEDVIFGKFDVGHDFLLVNHILLLKGSTIFIHKNVKRVSPPFRGSLLGLGVFTTLNFTLLGKEAN